MKSWRVACTAGVLCVVFACAPEEELGRASTDLYLFELWANQGLVSVGDARNLTDRDGYDNQPAFTPDGRGILYVQRSGDNAEIYRYDLDQDAPVRVTDTLEREYSPQALPGGGGFSVVRRERDGSQRVWRFEDDGTNPRLLVDVNDVLYYTWADDHTLALYTDDDPPSLYLADTSGGAVEKIAAGTGRSIQRVPGKRAISFVQKDGPADWWIVEMNLDTREVVRLARTLQGRVDHAWTPSGALVMALGSRLYMWVPDVSDQWFEVADFADEGLGNISRMAVSPEGDRMVVVSER
jgi:Tol biopolymer transport system component